MKSLLSSLLGLLLLFTYSPFLLAQESEDFPTVRFENHGNNEDENYRYRLGLAIDPLQSLFGHYPVSLQVALFDMFKIDLAAGLCTKPITPRLASRLTVKEASYHSKLAYEIGIKFYPEQYVFDDSQYFGLSLTRLNYEFMEPQSSGPPDFTNQEIYDISLCYGYDFPLDIDHFYLDLYSGISLRYNQQTHYSLENPDNQFVSDVGQHFRLDLGVKIGYLIK